MGIYSETVHDTAMVAGTMNLTEEARLAWADFLDNQGNRGHAGRADQGRELDEYFQLALTSARETVAMVARELPKAQPHKILEIGSSTGVNCLALQQHYPSADVIGLEPESEALEVAQQLAKMCGDPQPSFMCGVGEDIPLPDQSVDLIVCSTVIEHVYNVEKVIMEMGRVLRPGGNIYLAAPNYVWPKEPHLKIWGLPLLGKPLLRFAARLQGKAEQIGFLDHLQLVTPWKIERSFRAAGLSYTNYNKIKALRVMQSNESVKAYQKVRALLLFLNRIGIGRLVVSLAISVGFYPSLLYFAKQPLAHEQLEKGELRG